MFARTIVIYFRNREKRRDWLCVSIVGPGIAKSSSPPGLSPFRTIWGNATNDSQDFSWFAGSDVGFGDFHVLGIRVVATIRRVNLIGEYDERGSRLRVGKAFGRTDG